ncbi:MAG TPA: lysoplasmalogenase family protein [Flavobacterium sp.]|nr:lysoplasmalogenase family protein [Flavobacterium sp.]
MDQLVSFFKSMLTTKMVRPLTGIYFLVALVEIVAELNTDVSLISITKPLLMPLLIAIYWCSAKKINFLFVLSLLMVWIANLLFISTSMGFIIAATSFFLLYRILVMFIVFRMARFPGFLPLIIGCMPFLFLYIFVANLTYKELGEKFFLFAMQGMVMIVFGGYCLGNYILKSNKSNTYLLISTILFTAAQFILVIKIFYLSVNIFQPLAMLLFVSGQYLLYQYIVLEEKKRRRYKAINNI